MVMKIVKYFCWFFAFALILILLDAVFVLKHYGKTSDLNSLNSLAAPYDLREKADGFYEKKRDSLDLVFFGSSFCHTNINPNILWNEYGIVGYDFSADQQHIGLTRYYIEEMFKRQKPRLIVVEASVTQDEKYGSNVQLHFSLDPMRSGLQKTKAILANAKPLEVFEMFLPLVKYHSRWNDDLKIDLDYFFAPRHNLFNGNISLMGIKSFENISGQVRRIDESYKLPKRTIDSFLAIRKICQKNNCKVLFIFTPLAEPSAFDSSRKASVSFFEQNDFDFYDFNEHYDDIGTDFSTDYHDSVHMTYWGNIRFSKYLGKVIKERYDIPDRRGDKKYEQYDTDCKKMFELKKEFDLEYKKQKGVYPNPKEFE